MKHTYTDALRRGVFPHEGGYTNHPSDPGGPTNFGITIIDARKYWRSNATAFDVRTMPRSVAEDIYHAYYATPLRYDDLPAGLDYSVLDYGINSGVGRSGKVLRRVCGLPDNDWRVTDDVLRAVSKRDPVQLIAAINDERLAFLKRLKTWPVFGVGWGRRVVEVRTLSLNFAKSSQALQPDSLTTINGPVNGKGAVPAPSGLKNVVMTGPIAAGGAGGVTWKDWIAAHPWETGAIAVGAIVVIGGALTLINRWHQTQQESPTPGLVPVPEMKTV